MSCIAKGEAEVKAVCEEIQRITKRGSPAGGRCATGKEVQVSSGADARAKADTEDAGRKEEGDDAGGMGGAGWGSSSSSGWRGGEACSAGGRARAKRRAGARGAAQGKGRDDVVLEETDKRARQRTLLAVGSSGDGVEGGVRPLPLPAPALSQLPDTGMTSARPKRNDAGALSNANGANGAAGGCEGKREGAGVHTARPTAGQCWAVWTMVGDGGGGIRGGPSTCEYARLVEKKRSSAPVTWRVQWFYRLADLPDKEKQRLKQFGDAVAQLWDHLLFISWHMDEINELALHKRIRVR
jgi:hypothetical protein